MTKFNTLILTVGLPRSGKSRWARTQGCPIVNPDSIRLALHGERFIEEAEPMVWVLAKYMVKSLFYAGHTKIILDATNITKERRDFWKDEFWDVYLHYINTPTDVCIKRAIKDKRGNLIPIIERMHKEMNREMKEDGKT